MKTGDRLLDYPAELDLETAFVTTADGTRLRVLSAGDRSKPRLLCVHGFPQNAAEWRKLLPLVRDHFRVFLVDMRGYAKSDVAASGDYTLPTLAADLSRVLEETARADGAPSAAAHVCAHDWGGPIAWMLVTERPDLVTHYVCANAPHYLAYLREVLQNPRQLRGAWYTLLFQIPGIEHLLAAKGASGFARALMASSQKGTFSNEDLELYLAPLRDPERLKAAFSYYRAGFRGLLALRSRISEPRPPIEVPTTILWGEDDPAIHFSVAEATKRHYCPGAELRLIPGATHWVPDERPDLVAAALLDGLTRSRTPGNRRDIRRFGASG